MRGAGTGVLTTAVVSCTATAAVAVLPQLDFAYRRLELHVALETGACLVALLTAVLVAGRFRRYGHISDLALAFGLITLFIANLAPLLVLVATESAPGTAVVRVALTGRWLGAALFAVAALVPERHLRWRPLTGGTAGTTAVLLAGAVVCAVTWRATQEPAPALAGTPARPDLDVPAALLAMELTAALLYAMAAAGFLSRARRHPDRLYGWVAVASVLVATSHVNYFLYPSLLTTWVDTGDVFRVASYAVLFTGSMWEIASYWHALSQAAVAAERRRIARDLHDGVAQELAYLARNLGPLNGDTREATIGRLRRAAERAQFEARRAISTLSAPDGQSLAVALAAATGEVAERFQVGLDLDLADGVRLPGGRADALVRIACEAVANAARHSGASRVSLRLERDGPRVRLSVSDTGCGFDTSAGGGFGLVSMHERAESVGGELRIVSALGSGSQVEVML